jgi:glutamate dehydrogenase/leucine dehydrogenase
MHSAALTPEPGSLKVADLITGYGVAESVRHYYDLFGGEVAGKKVAIQGWGNVGAAAGFYLSRMGAKLIAISDKEGGLVRPSGLAAAEVEDLLRTKVGNSLVSKEKMPAAEMERALWSAGADIFIPAAASRVVSASHVNSLIKGGVELISCGANAPFEDDAMLFGALTRAVDDQVALIPDFVANAGMARAFSYLMGETGDLTEEAIFADTSACIKAALADIRSRGPEKTHIAARAFEIALGKIRAR